MEQRKTVHICWTGGWDSTYRMVELSQKEVVIQPVYIMDRTRPSLDIEIDTITRIREALINRSTTTARICPIKYIEMDEIPESAEITAAYTRLKSTVRLGSQYDYLARLATVYPGVEIGIEKPNGEFSGCASAIYKYGKLMQSDDTYIVDKDNSSKECILLFGNLSFPIIEITETEMVENIKKSEMQDIMQMIHFCYTPRRKKPCGCCRPCEQKIECGMGFLLPKAAHRRYKMLHIASKNKNGIIFRIYRKIVYYLF